MSSHSNNNRNDAVGDAVPSRSRSMTPTRSAASPALSASLAAHLSKPVATTSTATSAATTHASADGDGHVQRLPPGAQTGQNNGKAPAVAGDAVTLADGDLWKSAAARRAEKAWAQQSERTLQQSDPRFKKYTAAVDKCLASFDSVSEWADFIAFLSRLLKTLQASPHFNAIPRKLIVAKRLSQCLNPALPSGVHQRALEVYDHIFSVIALEGLRRDLPVWSPGLLPFFPFASTAVKPIVLSIIERYYFPLAQDLRGIARPLQLSLLPGLEEESGEFFDRVLKVLDSLLESVGRPYFLQILWLQLITIPSVRLAALHFLARRLPHLNASLEDENSLLVQRAMLDLLISHLRIDSPTFRCQIRQDDRIHLLHAAMTVVLKRDLSLNRRLYAWVLGPSEEQSMQQEYFKKYALEYARASLMDDLAQASAQHVDSKNHVLSRMTLNERQKPIRIIISLLDKWSIGLPLINAMIVDILKSLKDQLRSQYDQGASVRAGTSDISTTAKMLFEAVDPFGMYRQLFYALRTEANQKSDEMQDTTNVSLLRFVFSSFRVHDEESRVIHLPTLLAAIIELAALTSANAWKLEAMQLAREILSFIPKRVFANRSRDSAAKTTTFVQHAAQLYDESASSADEAARSYIGFQHPESLAALLDACSAHFGQPLRTDVIVEASTVLCALFSVIDASTSSPSLGDAQGADYIPWDSKACQQKVLASIPGAQTFAEVEAYIEVLVASQRCKAFRERQIFASDDVTEAVTEKLLDFMRRPANPCHVRAVDLFWTIADLARSDCLGSLLCQRITSAQPAENEAGFEAFDVLWTHSEEFRLSSPTITEPLFCVLDGLQASTWDERQLAEAWVRNSTRSFTALLDPLLALVDSDRFVREPCTKYVEGITIEQLLYRRLPNFARIQHALNLLLHLAKVGGPSFARAMRSLPARQSISEQSPASRYSSYSSYTIQQLLAVIQTDTYTSDASTQVPESTHVHAYAAELLQIIVSKSTADEHMTKSVRDVLLQRLLVDVDREVLQSQAKTLQALHGVMALQPLTGQTKILSSSSPPPPPLLLPTLKAGLSRSSNRKVVQHWADFVIAMAPIYRTSLSTLLMPLNQGLCALLRASLDDLQDAYDASEPNTICSTTDTDVISLISMSEKVLLQSLDHQGSAKAADSTSTFGFSEKVDPFGFMGALTNAFSADPISVDGADQPTSNAVWKSLHHTVRTLHHVWLISTPTDAISLLAAADLADSRVDTLTYVKARIHARCRRYLEKLYRNHSGEVVEALIACWQAGTTTETSSSLATFEILTLLAPSAQIVVTFLCDVISTRTAPVAAGDKTQKNSAIPVVSNGVLFAFLEAYLNRLDAVATLQVWPVVIMLIKDILSNSTQHKAQIFPSLRCLTVAAQRIMDSQKAEDRRIRKELFDSYVRLCDLAILIAGRNFESTTWIGRRALQAGLSDGDGKETPMDDPMSSSIGDISTSSSSHIDALQLYLAEHAFPALRKFAIDADKVVGLCSNVVYYIVAPALRQRRSGAPDINHAILALLIEITRHPGSFKVWRTVVADFSADPKFFLMNIKAGEGWAPVIYALMNGDKERFVETVGRVSTPSTNIFTNREAETALRATHMRRMSYAIYIGPRDHWLPQLPLIQEKLVELLRSGAADPVVCEVYLCLRILLMRFSSQHLSGLWPVVITEMVRLFEDCLEDLPADDSDKLMLLFAACKFLDLLVTLQTDEFQIHQWLFITDTADIVYPPDDWVSESLLDRLATAVGERRSGSQRLASGVRSSNKALRRRDSPASRNGTLTDASTQAGATTAFPSLSHGQQKRRPLLLDHTGMRTSTIEALQPFFANASLHAFESTYASGHNIDMDAVEHSLIADMFSLDDEDHDARLT